jgi:hypothetical protein
MGSTEGRRDHLTHGRRSQLKKSHGLTDENNTGSCDVTSHEHDELKKVCDACNNAESLFNTWTPVISLLSVF